MSTKPGQPQTLLQQQRHSLTFHLQREQPHNESGQRGERDHLQPTPPSHEVATDSSCHCKPRHNPSGNWRKRCPQLLTISHRVHYPRAPQTLSTSVARAPIPTPVTIVRNPARFASFLRKSRALLSTPLYRSQRVQALRMSRSPTRCVQRERRRQKQLQRSLRPSTDLPPTIQRDGLCVTYVGREGAPGRPGRALAGSSWRLSRSSRRFRVAEPGMKDLWHSRDDLSVERQVSQACPSLSRSFFALRVYVCFSALFQEESYVPPLRVTPLAQPAARRSVQFLKVLTGGETDW